MRYLSAVGTRDSLDAIEARLDYDAAHRYVHGDIFKAGTPKCTDVDYFQKGGDRNFQLVNQNLLPQSCLPQRI